jgi:hypothetical protein
VVKKALNEHKKCIIRLRKYCVVYDALNDIEKEKYGSKSYVLTYCGLCIKSYYAKAKIKLINKYSVVNTL